uniref:Uncharacterized protein n=1 Tax=Arundo donax TaxID=35708 RepID=A0A0A9FXB3_ARUDO
MFSMLLCCKTVKPNEIDIHVLVGCMSCYVMDYLMSHHMYGNHNRYLLSNINNA